MENFTTPVTCNEECQVAFFQGKPRLYQYYTQEWCNLFYFRE